MTLSFMSANCLIARSRILLTFCPFPAKNTKQKSEIIFRRKKRKKQEEAESFSQNATATTVPKKSRDSYMYPAELGKVGR